MSERAYEVPAGLWAWLCDKCGQELMGAYDTCNSGYHVGPDGQNVGKPISSAELFERYDALAVRLADAEKEATEAREERLDAISQWERADKEARELRAERDEAVNGGLLMKGLLAESTAYATELLAERDEAQAAIRDLLPWMTGGFTGEHPQHKAAIDRARAALSVPGEAGT